jgi:hypothetical protein
MGWRNSRRLTVHQQSFSTQWLTCKTSTYSTERYGYIFDCGFRGKRCYSIKRQMWENRKTNTISHEIDYRSHGDNPMNSYKFPSLPLSECPYVKESTILHDLLLDDGI